MVVEISSAFLKTCHRISQSVSHGKGPISETCRGWSVVSDICRFTNEDIGVIETDDTEPMIELENKDSEIDDSLETEG